MKEIYTVRMTKFPDDRVIFSIMRDSMQFQIHVLIEEFDKLVELCLDIKEIKVSKPELVSKTIEISSYKENLK